MAIQQNFEIECESILRDLTDGVGGQPCVPAEEIRVLDTLQEIGELATLQSNWDLEGAVAIDQGAAKLAAQLALQVDLAARGCDYRWQEPVVGPDPDGGIDLLWKGEGRRVVLMTRPGQPDTVECVIKSTDTEPFRTSLSISDAVARVLWALGKHG